MNETAVLTRLATFVGKAREREYCPAQDLKWIADISNPAPVCAFRALSALSYRPKESGPRDFH